MSEIDRLNPSPTLPPSGSITPGLTRIEPAIRLLPGTWLVPSSTLGYGTQPFNRLGFGGIE